MKWKNAVKKVLNKPEWKPAWEAASENALTKSSLSSVIIGLFCF